MTSAITPPIRKNANDVIRYIWPINLWSVVVRTRTSLRPSGRRGRTKGPTDPILAVSDQAPVLVIADMCQLLADRIAVVGLSGPHRPTHQFAGGSLAGNESSPHTSTMSRSGREGDAGGMVPVRQGCR